MDTRTRSELERYADESPALAARLDFFERLWGLQDEIAQDAPAWDVPDEETVREALATGQPAILVSMPGLPLTDFADAVRRISKLASEEESIDESLRDFLTDADLAGTVEGEALERALEDFDGFCDDVAGSVDAADDARAIVEFVLFSAATPFLSAAVSGIDDMLGTIDRDVWSSGTCPVCGTPAAIGRIIDAGELEGDVRLLTCGLCRAEWAYDRLRCARCGTRDHSKLRYLFEESDPAHRVHVCEACHGYLKVTDEREAGRQVVPIVEDTVTTLLDAIAKDRGYAQIPDAETVEEESS
jgi:FdhE protein